MAHADYDCCAICDCKMEYNAFDAQTKEEICGYCLEKIKNLGLNINNVEEFKEYVINGEYEEVKENLIKLGYCFCYYPNDLDKEIFYKFFRQNGNFEKLLKNARQNVKIIAPFTQLVEQLTLNRMVGGSIRSRTLRKENK